MTFAQIFPEDVLVSEVAEAASARGMHIISDGHRVLVSPIVPPGFFKVAVKVKSPNRAELAQLPFAA